MTITDGNGANSARDVTDALAQLASGVAIVSLWREGAPQGLLVSSLIGLSVDPPRVLFTVRRDASAYAALMAEDRCAAVILAAGDREDAALFSSSRSAGERFASPSWDLPCAHAPMFKGGLARFELRIHQRLDAGANAIIIADILAVASTPGEPLVYHARRLTGLVADAQIVAAAKVRERA
ncbi:flavin reductase family protein [Phenylobacterium immobile]|uniref:flavin reductase family protein n=1 Tax=Phenylobacterium immobile TaxID=21 RepID=UPI000B1F94E0|nr:flavin reductase family protein [Phenylobacterium immobile]